MAAHHCIGTGADERRHWLAPDKAAALESTVQAIAVAGKGISACDESGRTINPRFANVGIEATEEMRSVPQKHGDKQRSCEVGLPNNPIAVVGLTRTMRLRVLSSLSQDPIPSGSDFDPVLEGGQLGGWWRTRA